MSVPAEIYWRSRRGILELDLLLQSYLQHGYQQASSTEQQWFAHLLGLEDTVLYAYLLGEALPAQAELQNLVLRVRGLRFIDN